MDAKLERAVFRLLAKGGAFAESEYPALAAAARRARRPLAEHLLAEGKTNESDVALAIAEASGLEFEELDPGALAAELSKEVPAAMALRSGVVPVLANNGSLSIVAAEPLAGTVLENLRRISNKRLTLRIGTRTAIADALKALYGQGPDEPRREGQAEDEPDAASAVALLDSLLNDAAQQQASDIHIEPEEAHLRVRLRVDGMLREHNSYPKSIVPALVSRVKVLAKLNIAEKRSPQDGGFYFPFNGENIDLRISTLPSLFGEKVVIRLLTPKSRNISLDTLGLEPEQFEQFKTLITRPHGIILITGPTGSGKSTTLYAALLMVKTAAVNITTVEDPIEYQIDGITQTQVDHAEKLTFAKALRAMLRQDPDVIMVGEVRDRETADIALRAALTGHLVFSTLHTNDATGALTRLLDMGCEPYLVSSSVCGVLAQRLLRVICPACKEPYTPAPEMVKRIGLPDPEAPRTWYRGRGCSRCHQTGFRGRIGTFELVGIDDDIRQQVVERAPTDQIRRLAIAKGMRTLRQDALLKVEKGVTTPEEALRVTTFD